MIYSEKEMTRIVRSLLGTLYTKGYTKYRISIEIGVSEKTLYKWENGTTTPKAMFYLNLEELCKKATRGIPA